MAKRIYSFLGKRMVCKNGVLIGRKGRVRALVWDEVDGQHGGWYGVGELQVQIGRGEPTMITDVRAASVKEAIEKLERRAWSIFDALEKATRNYNDL